MNEVQRIYDYLSSTEKTLVFTSETAARNAVSSYVEMHPGKAVFNSRCVSWDRFYLSLLDTRGKRSATKTERRVFAYTFLTSGGLDKLRYFAFSKYRESILAYSSSIAALLPYFPSADDSIRQYITQRDMLGDIDILKKEYEEYLEKKGLYEKNYLKPDYSLIKKDEYVFVFPSTFTSTKAGEIISLGLVETIDIPSSDTPLTEYPNSLTEIRCTLRRIEEDRKKYRDDEIALTSSSLQTYRPYLESEAKKRDIPLVFTSSLPLSSYPEGRFLHDIYSAVNSGWSFEETKKLLLNPAYPFSERKRMVRIIRAATEGKLEDGGIMSWMRLLSSDDREFFGNLTSIAGSIVKSRRSSLVIKHIQEFRDSFFEEGEWREEEDRVLGSAIEILEKTGDDDTENLYTLFLSLLDETEYVERTENAEGIRVYAYPASAGLITRVHYVIGLDDRTTEEKIDDYPFLTSLSRPDPPEISSSVLSLYRSPLFASDLVLSGTSEGFDGARLLPPLFLDSAIKNTDDRRDGYREERKLWIDGLTPEGKPYISQSEGYRRAESTALKGRKEEVLVTPFTGEETNISVSKMKDWDMCPYRGYASTRLKIEEKKFEPEMEDPLIIGNILHGAIEKELEEAGRICDIDEERLKLRFLEKLDEEEKKHHIPAKYAAQHIRGRFIERLKAVKESPKAGIYESLTLLENEKKITPWPLTGKITVSGRLDTILENRETGECYIIDWKTTGKNDYSTDLKEISLQVILYAVLLENDESVNIKGGAFYSFADGTYRIVWPGEEYTSGTRKYHEGFDVTLLKSEIDERLTRIRKSLEEGNFTPRVTEHSCTNCHYERLCRAKFASSLEENNE